MKLDVVTLTRGGEPRWIDECIYSVAAALPPYGRHRIIRSGDFQRDRWQSTARSDAQYVAWVDDDDRVLPDALDDAVRALDKTGAAIAFTLERRIDEDGVPFPNRPHRAVTKRDVAMHPRSLHHLTVVRTASLSDEIYEHACRIGVGLDWLIRAWCTLRHDAVVVPKVGYEWRQHAGQDTRDPAWTEAFDAAMPELRRVTRSWMTYDAPINRIVPR